MYVYNLYNSKKIKILEYKEITLRNQVYDRNQVDDWQKGFDVFIQVFSPNNPPFSLKI